MGVLPAQADSGKAKVGFGVLAYEGQTVRTVVTPTSTPGRGVDALYPVVGGADGQLPVTSVVPGDKGYHGGRWAVHVVTWNSAPYLLASADEVNQAVADGDANVERAPAADFVCPIRGTVK